MSLPTYPDHPDRACRGKDITLFFPETGISTERAKELCEICVVQDECLQYALRSGTLYGVFGGVNFSSEAERRLAHGQRDTNAIDQRVRQLYDLGWSDPQIARELGVHKVTVRRSRLRQQLPALFGTSRAQLEVAS